MTAQDRMTGKEFELLQQLLEGNFKELALAHDAACTEAVAHFEAKDQTRTQDSGEVRYTGAGEMSVGMHHSRRADAIKALMLYRFPEASEAWFA